MYDFNDVQIAPPRYDLRAIEDRLRSTAPFWLPRYFPGGRQTNDRSEIRCADISGRTPRKEGSCVVRLTGPHAGTAYDWDGGQAYSAIDIIGVHENLSGPALFDRAASIAGVGAGAVPSTVQRAPALPKDDTRTKAEIEFILSGCQPAAGTLVETYLASRGLVLPASPDILFHPDLADRGGTNRGWPAMVAVVRHADGAATGGIHRTFLADDGSAKADIERVKRMWGAVKGGVWMGDAASTEIAVGEGIETTASGMAIFGVPRSCAALSTSGMEVWVAPAGTTAVLILADAGKGGEDAAGKLSDRLSLDGVPNRIIRPLGGDDFNADLRAGRTAADYAPVIVATPAAPTLSSYDEMHAAAMAMSRETDHLEIGRLLMAVIMSGLEAVPTKHVLDAIKSKTAVSTKTLETQIREMRRKLTPAVTARSGTRWAASLILGNDGTPERNIANISIAIDQDPALNGLWAFDDFAQSLNMTRPPPWDSEVRDHVGWTDIDDVRFAVWLQQRGLNVSDGLANKAVQEAARRNSFDPLREHFDALQWDGVERLSTWTIRYLGSGDTPFARVAGAAWMIGGIARTYEPGAKVDTMLILEGPQGLKKSSALAALAGDAWFTDDVLDLGDKDTLMNMQGKLIVEMAELGSFSKTEVKHLNAFVTRRNDRFRPPYGRVIADHPRRFILAGTTNDDTYLRDETGGRRFWPVTCTRIDLDALKQDRDQLWAEAIVQYRAGVKWWIEDPDILRFAREEQEARYQDDAWAQQIERWLTHDRRTEDYGIGVGLRTSWIQRKEPISDVSIGEVLEGAMSIEPSRWARSDQMRISAYLKSKKWDRYQKGGRGNQEWRYRRPLWLLEDETK